MTQAQFTLTSVTVVGPSRLALSFADGYSGKVDLGDTIAGHPTLARLRNRRVFARVALDE